MVSRNEIQEKIINIITNVTERKTCIEEIHGNTRLADLGVNSISFVKATVQIELEFEFEFGDDDLDFSKYSQINDLVSYVEGRI